MRNSIINMLQPNVKSFAKVFLYVGHLLSNYVFLYDALRQKMNLIEKKKETV